MTIRTVEPGSYRSFFGQVPTGVTVIVSESSEGPVGMVVGTFASVSIDPPLVMFMVRNESRSYHAVRAAGRFTANILASDQGRLSTSLAGWSPEKFRDITFDPDQSNPLVLSGCLAWADCSIESEIQAGDHLIVLAAPEQLDVLRPRARPLVFCQGAYHRTLHVEDARAPGWT